MRVVFMGTPEFAVPSLSALSAVYNVVSVYTQPDRRAGRGRQLTQSPVKIKALDLHIPVAQPDNLMERKTIKHVESLHPHLVVVAAYGRILPPAFLSIPKIACVNVHASLLPRWRGAAPVEAAIRAGDKVTGISIMKMDPGLDTGPVYLQKEIRIKDGETGGELTLRLSELGAESLLEALPGIVSGTLKPVDQDETFATYAPMLKKNDGLLNFEKPAFELNWQVRAYEPWPSSYFQWKDTRIVVREARALQETASQIGDCFIHEGFPAIGANPGSLLLLSVQPAGKRRMTGKTFLNGAKDFPHGRITHPSAP